MLGQKAETYDDERRIASPSDVTNCGRRSSRTLTLVTHTTPNPGRNRAAGVVPRCLTDWSGDSKARLWERRSSRTEQVDAYRRPCSAMSSAR